MNHLIAIFTLPLCVILSGCQRTTHPAGSSQSDALGDLVITITTEPVEETTNQLRTNVTIERIGPDGSSSTIASPTILALVGQPASIKIGPQKANQGLPYQSPQRESE